MRSALPAAILAPFALVVACGKPEPAPPSKPALEFIVAVVPQSGGSTRARVLADGKQLAELGLADRRELRFVAASENPAMSLQLHLPCGWREVPLYPPVIVKRPFAGTDQHGKPYRIPGEITLAGVTETERILVDNRGRGAAKLELGELARDVPADKPHKLSIYSPDCEGGAALRLDGQPIGRVPAPEPKRIGDRAWLVDPAGKRCYEHEARLYSRFGGGREPPPPERYVRQQLHRMRSMPHYVFEEAPPTISSQSYLESRAQLLETKCPP